MRRSVPGLCLAVLALFVTTSPVLAAPVKALVGGRLIDGYGGAPIENSVVLIEGGPHQDGGPGRRGRDPRGGGGDLHRGDERAARPVGHARPPDDRRARGLQPLGQDVSGPLPLDDHAGGGEAAPSGRRDQRAGPRSAARRQHRRARGDPQGRDPRAEPLRLRAVPPARALSRHGVLPLGDPGARRTPAPR